MHVELHLALSISSSGGLVIRPSSLSDLGHLLLSSLHFLVDVGINEVHVLLAELLQFTIERFDLRVRLQTLREELGEFLQRDGCR